MLKDTCTLKMLENKSDDMKMLHVLWFTASRTSCTLSVCHLLPKVPLLMQSKLIFKNSHAMPYGSAGITSKCTMNSGASQLQKGIDCKIKNRF